jgi:hypothetical protein
MKENKKAKFDFLTFLALIALIWLVLYFAGFISSFITSGTASSTSLDLMSSAAGSTSEAASSSISSASSTQAGFSIVHQFMPARVAESSFSDRVAYLFTPDNVTSLIFACIFLVIVVALFVALLTRKDKSHIGYTVLVSGLVFAYSLTKAIICFTSGAVLQYANAGVLYCVAALASLFQIVFFILKALDGDADWRYMTSSVVTAVFLFLASAFQYSLLDAYSHMGDTVFWQGYSVSRLIIFVEIIAIIVSLRSDYDPNPILLDEFGNPIDVLKKKKTMAESGIIPTAPVNETKKDDKKSAPTKKP